MSLIPRYRIYKIGELSAVILFDIITCILLLPAKLLHLFKRKSLLHFSHDNLKKILIFRTDRIGDLVMTLPAISLLRKHFPHSQVHLVTGEWNQDIVKHFKGADKIFYWNPSWISRGNKSDSFIHLVRKAFDLRKSKYDLAIDFASDIRINILMWITGAKRRIGYSDSGGGAFLTKTTKERGIHRVEQNLEPLRAIGVVKQNTIPSLEGMIKFPAISKTKLSSVYAKAGIRNLKDFVIIHPWGGRLVKTWNVDKYAALAVEITNKLGLNVLLTGDIQDKTFCSEIEKKSGGVAHNLAGKNNLEELMSLMKSARLFISPDTGPMHIAVALGIPTVTLFGPSDPVKYAPYGNPKSHRIVTPRKIDCLHCNKIRKPPRRCMKDGISLCMDAITVQSVYKECQILSDTFLKRSKGGISQKERKT
jgi:lipopolysaccharide heptosyltransferase II